jgi:hypothetical protein
VSRRHTQVVYRDGSQVFRNYRNARIKHMQFANSAKRLATLFSLTLALSGGLLLPETAQAHEPRVDRRVHSRAVHGHSGVRVSSVVVAPVIRVGPPAYAYYPGWYHDPYWGWRYSSPRIIVPAPAPVITVPAPVYVERADVIPPPAATPAPSAPVAGYWYWCSSPAGYHPAVTDCPGGWTAVAPAASRP